MEENFVGLHCKDVEPQRLLFGSFSNEDYDTYFGVGAAVHPGAVEFLFDRQNDVSDWINQGTWFRKDLDNHKVVTASDAKTQSSCIEEETAGNVSVDVESTNLQKSETVSETAEIKASDISVQNEAPTTGQLVNGTALPEVVQTSKPAPAEKPTVKPTSWAALFKKPSIQSNNPPVKQQHVSASTGALTNQENHAKTPSGNVPDPLRDLLSGHPMPSHSLFSFQLRGLINSSNWCFINATLQALMACPRFYPVYTTLPKRITTEAGLLTWSMLDFINNFNQLKIDELPAKPQSIGVRAGLPFEPKSIYDCLPSSKSSLSEKGRQQDAEEFLSFLLNGLHDELVAIRNQLYPRPTGAQSEAAGDQKKKDIDAEKLENGLDVNDEWHHVGPKNRSALTRETQHEASLITNIFGGTLRSAVRHSGAKESATLQPFFTLPLDIQSDGVKTVTDALRNFFAKECLQGYTCQKTNSEVDASRKTSLESLPSVLILHLKYFLYDQSGGCQKIHKPINISVELNISKDMVSTTAKTVAPAYSLFAVVYHHGKSAADGHYTAAVRDRSTNPPHLWVHCDDSSIEPCSVNDVIHHAHARTPYLLFYQRNF